MEQECNKLQMECTIHCNAYPFRRLLCKERLLSWPESHNAAADNYLRGGCTLCIVPCTMHNAFTPCNVQVIYCETHTLDTLRLCPEPHFSFLLRTKVFSGTAGGCYLSSLTSILRNCTCTSTGTTRRCLTQCSMTGVRNHLLQFSPSGLRQTPVTGVQSSVA